MTAVQWPTGRPLIVAPPAPLKGCPTKDWGAEAYHCVERIEPRVNVAVRVWDARTPELERRARLGEGRLLAAQLGHNLVPTGGRNLLRDLLDMEAVPPGPLTQFALGDDDTPVSNNDLALGNQLLIDAITRTVSTDLKLQCQYFLPSTSLNGADIWEAGLFTAGGTLYARYVLGVIADIQPKSIGSAVTFTWDLTWTVTTMNILDRGAVIDLGGHPDDYQTGNAYPAGATFDKLVPGSGVWHIDSADLFGGTFALEGIVKVSNGTATATLALVNLDDGSPDTPLAGSEVQSAAGVTTGELVRTGAITFPAAGAAKKLGVKMKTDEAAADVWAWGLRIIRLT